MVYFAKLATGEIKIGLATISVADRIRSLRGEYGDLTLIGAIDGDLDVERIMHNRFWPFHIRGELFIPGAPLYHAAGRADLFEPDPRFNDCLFKAMMRYEFGKDVPSVACCARRIHQYPQEVVERLLPILDAQRREVSSRSCGHHCSITAIQRFPGRPNVCGRWAWGD